MISLFRVSPHETIMLDDNAAGFESYREFLWGSDAMSSRGMTFFPQLRDGDIYVAPDELEAFRLECLRVIEHSDSIADELWPEDPQAKDWFYLDSWMRHLKEWFFPATKVARIAEVKKWGGNHIRTYMHRFLDALDRAEEEGLGVNIG